MKTNYHEGSKVQKFKKKHLQRLAKPLTIWRFEVRTFVASPLGIFCTDIELVRQGFDKHAGTTECRALLDFSRPLGMCQIYKFTDSCVVFCIRQLHW